MTGRERVLAALNRQEPDKVPWIETYVHDEMVEKLVGHLVDVPRQVRINPAVYEVLPLDNLNYNFKAPDFAEIRVIDGIDYVGRGLIRSRADLDQIRLPDPTKEEFYRPAREYLDKYGGQLAAMANLRSGPANTYLSMGMDVFSYALYDDPSFVEEVLDIFADWYAEVAGNLARLGFDFAVIAEDLADKSGPIFSPAVVREFFLPRMKRVVDRLQIPWIWHSDGNVGPLDLARRYAHLGDGGNWPPRAARQRCGEVQGRVWGPDCLPGQYRLALYLDPGHPGGSGGGGPRADRAARPRRRLPFG